MHLWTTKSPSWPLGAWRENKSQSIALPLQSLCTWRPCLWTQWFSILLLHCRNLTVLLSAEKQQISAPALRTPHPSLLSYTNISFPTECFVFSLFHGGAYLISEINRAKKLGSSSRSLALRTYHVAHWLMFPLKFCFCLFVPALLRTRRGNSLWWASEKEARVDTEPTSARGTILSW